MTRRKPVSRLWDTPDWMKKAACIIEGEPEWWFPERDGTLQTAQAATMAIRICNTCPVQRKCLAYADEHHEQGIWGGLTEHQRALRRTTTERRHLCSVS